MIFIVYFIFEGKMEKNDLIEVLIEDVSLDGKGIARYNGIVIFVPFAAVGDKLIVKILKVKKDYAFGKTEKILKKSLHRINVDCDSYYKCGGCVFRHISYDEELRIKSKFVKDSLNKFAGITNFNVSDIIGAKDINHYRNKAQVPVRYNRDQKIISGFFSPHSHNVVECLDCKLHPKEFDKIIFEIKKWMQFYKIVPYDETANTGLLRHIYLRYAKSTNEIMVCLVINGESIPCKDILVRNLTGKFENIKSICLNINRKSTNVILGDKNKVLFGEDFIQDILCDTRFNISPLSFYQINHDQTEIMYDIAKNMLNLKNTDNVLDLYCGIGTIGLTMALDINKLLGIEVIKQAVENAIKNSEINNIRNSDFICGDVVEEIDYISSYIKNVNTIIIDPPRKGCDGRLIDTIMKISPEKILYISCNPCTWARDLKILCKQSYNLRSVVPIDLFPRTGHVEVVCLLSKLKSDKHINVELEMDKLDLTAEKSKATYADIEKLC